MLVSICIVAFNEEKNLSDIFADLLSQTYPHKNIELVFVDNRSSDRTHEILCAFRDEHISEFYGIQVLQNTENSVLSRGLNIAMDAYRGDVYVRVDAHASLDIRFVEETVACLCGAHEGTVPEYACGGMRPTYPPDDSGMSALLLAAENSRFGASVASYRGEPARSYVTSIFHAAYRREVTEKVGKFNEQLYRTEDNEYNYRVGEAGYKICFEPRIKSAQQIRSSLPKMLKQKNSNGYWIGYTLGVCPKCTSLFHFVPAAFVGAILASIIIALLGCIYPAVLLFGVYTLFNIIFSAKAIIDAEKFTPHLLLLPFIFLLMHLFYGVGTYKGLFCMLLDKAKKKI